MIDGALFDKLVSIPSRFHNFPLSLDPGIHWPGIA